MLHAKCVIGRLGENREYQETLLEVFAPKKKRSLCTRNIGSLDQGSSRGSGGEW